GGSDAVCRFPDALGYGPERFHGRDDDDGHHQHGEGQPARDEAAPRPPPTGTREASKEVDEDDEPQDPEHDGRDAAEVPDVRDDEPGEPGVAGILLKVAG